MCQMVLKNYPRLDAQTRNWSIYKCNCKIIRIILSNVSATKFILYIVHTPPFTCLIMENMVVGPKLSLAGCFVILI